MFRYLTYFSLVLLLLLCFLKKSFTENLIFFSYSPDREWVIGLPPVYDLEIDPDGNPLILAREGTVYLIHPETYIVEKHWEIHSPSSLRFSPDKTKVLITPKEAPDTFSVLDWNTKRIIWEEECKDKSISFLNNGRFVLKHDKKNETATIYDLQENSQFTVETKNILQILEIQPAQRCIVGIYGVKEYDETRYYSEIKETFYHRWNYVNGAVLEHKLLEDSRQYTADRYKILIDFIKSPAKADEVIGMLYDMESGYVAYHLKLWNTLTGKLVKRIPESLYYDGESLEITPDGKFLLDYTQTWVADITNLKTTGFVAYAGPFAHVSISSHFGDMVFDELKDILYLHGISEDGKGIYVYDIPSRKFIMKYPFLHRPILQNEAAFSSANELITYSSLLYGFEYKWDFDKQSLQTSFLPKDSVTLSQIACFSPDDALAVGIADQSVKILNGALDTILHSLTVSETDDRYQAAFSPDGARLLVATGRESDPGTDNLIRIYETMNFEAVRDLRGHTDSVWYADFSPDGRRIVSASRDGTAKVWDTETGAIVSDFVVHATGVVYARFFPDGRRVLSADNDHRAYIWDAQTARIEQTLESIHLPARLSPDGQYLFAGTEVWDIAAGQIIKTLDGEAKDLQCLALSPDGSLLLTSESEGLTKVWKVREHILKPAGIEDFEMY